MTPIGLGAELHARLTVRHGSPEKAAEKAQADPRFADEFRRAQAWQMLSHHDPDKSAAASAEWWALVDAWDRVDAAEAPPATGEGDAPPQRVAKRKREPDRLEVQTVTACEAKLRERAAVLTAGERAPHELTLEGIGEAVGLNRERVRHIEQLLRLGWPLQKRHPEVSAEDGYVRLPSVDKAAAALGLSDDEKAARLAETSLSHT